MSEAPDEELVARVRAGDRELYAELVRRHHPRVMGLCLSMLGDRASAEDAAQDAFLRAYGALAGFEGQSAFATWLYRIASNRCLDLLRQRARRAEDALEAASARPAPEAASDEAELVRAAVASLPDDYRLIVALREIEGLSYEELAETLDCTLDAVKARLRRARAALEERLRHFS